MSDERTDLAIRMEILAILDQCKGYLLAQDALYNQLNIALSGIAITKSDLVKHLEFLRSKGMADYSFNAAGGPKRWQITDNGKAVFREYQYDG